MLSESSLTSRDDASGTTSISSGFPPWSIQHDDGTSSTRNRYDQAFLERDF